MKFKPAVFIFLMFLVTVATYAANIEKVKLPKEVIAEVARNSVPKELEGLQWNRWTSKNFTVCALDDTQAQYLHKHLELVKDWALVRWGLYDIDFSAECKMIVVHDPALFKKFFSIDATRVEVRRNPDGTIKESVIFLLGDQPPSHIVPVPVSEVAMAEFAQRYNTKFGWWAYRGMGNLNGSISQIKSQIKELGTRLANNQGMHFTKGLLEMKPEDYAKLDQEQSRLYDNEAAIFCLYVRKEFGQDVYLNFLKNASENSPQTAIQKTLKFESYDHLNRTFKRYMLDLAKDVSEDKTPESYLQIREK